MTLLPRLQTLFPGLALAALLAFAATSVSRLYGGPQLLYALLMGMAFHWLASEPRTRGGIDLAAKTVLRFGVALLGARISATQIASLGWQTALAVVCGVATTLAVGVLLARRMGMSRSYGVLSGGSVAICGASAALAISAVLPADKDRERQTLMVVVSVTVISTIAMVIYPMLARLLNLPPALAGLFIGGSIHDVAQVVGAGYILGVETGDYATVVKLFRVALLTLVVLGVALAFRHARGGQEVQAAGAKRQPLVPWFLWVFVALVVLNSAGAVPAVVADATSIVSRACLVVAIAALGVKTSFQQLAQAGWRPLMLILIETAWLAAVILGFIAVMR